MGLGIIQEVPMPSCGARSYMGLGIMKFGVGARKNNALRFWQAPMPIRTYMGLGCKNGVFICNGACTWDRTKNRRTGDGQMHNWERAICAVLP